MEIEQNPWDVISLFNFQLFCCPDCVYKVSGKQEFVNHALENHPESVKFLAKIQDESMTDVLLPFIPNSNHGNDQDLSSTFR